MMAMLRILSIWETLFPRGEKRGVSQRPKRSQTSIICHSCFITFRAFALTSRYSLQQFPEYALGNGFKGAPLRCRVDPFTMLADQILQSVHCFRFGNVEFTAAVLPTIPRICLTEMLPDAQPSKTSPIGNPAA
jgi:hypothetical protein